MTGWHKRARKRGFTACHHLYPSDKRDEGLDTCVVSFGTLLGGQRMHVGRLSILAQHFPVNAQPSSRGILQILLLGIAN